METPRFGMWLTSSNRSEAAPGLKPLELGKALINNARTPIEVSTFFRSGETLRHVLGTK